MTATGIIDPAAINWDSPIAIGQAADGMLARLGEEHGFNSPAFRKSMLAGMKELVRLSREHARQRLTETRKGLECAGYLSQVQDELISALYHLAATKLYPAINPTSGERVSVVAVGGYGRGTLAPGSDIDLLFVLPYKQTAWGEQMAEYLLYMLWDLGFKVGYSSRSVDECIRLSREDNTILTATLEARYICGDERLYADLARRFRDEVVSSDPAQFITDKLGERDARHKRFGESRYLVEPDVKEGKGGLRDLHTLFWIGKYVYGVQDVSGLVAHGLFTRAELRRFLKAEDFFWAVRCHMHFIAGRGDDKLSFDMQPRVAECMGYRAARGMKNVERFMRHYFLFAKDVGDLTRIFCAGLEERQIKPAPRLPRIIGGLLGKGARGPRKRIGHADFTTDNGRITVADKKAFERDPANLLRLFVLADEHDLAIHPDALALARRSLKLITDEVRADEEANRLFLHLLCGTRDPEGTLRKLNEAGVLGRFIPEFGRIVALMQFNMYHHYTVDEHLIRAVGWLARIERGELKEEHPLSWEIFQKLTSRRALYVATLLHDIAKGRPEDHSVAGEKIARRLCPRLGLNEAETELVCWLVRHHLVMSETSQMRDLSDFKTILDFAEVVQSPERLKLLLVLTVVDIRAVGPGVWNGWKGQLLRTLYYETEPVVSGGHASIPHKQRVEAAQQAFAEAIGWPEEKVQAWLPRLYDPYWLTTDTGHQVRDARLIEQAEEQGESLAIGMHTDAFTAVTEITVYTPDHPHLLALLTGACAAAGASIMGAKIFTTANGMALDTLILKREFAEDADAMRRAERIAGMIRKALRGEVNLPRLVAEVKQPQGRLKAFHVTPSVVINNESSNRFTVIEVAGKDRIGLLYHLTATLFSLSLNIASAQITTFGERAVDVFYVTDLTGAKITSENRQAIITEALKRVLEGEKREQAA